MAAKGLAPWRPSKQTEPFLDQVLDVILSQREYWPLTQRYWLYRLMAKHGWLKVDEYSPQRSKPEKRHLCTPGKNLNNILNRGRRAGVIPWEAVASSRGMVEKPLSRDTPEQLASLVQYLIDDCQFERQNGQYSQVVLWVETEGLVPLVETTAHYYGATLLAGKGFDVVGRKYDFAERIAEQGDVTILHCGDLDKSGHSVFRSLEEDLQAFISDLGGRMTLKRIALTEAQTIEYGLQTSPAPPGLNAGNHGSGFNSSVECQLEALDAPDLISIIKSVFENELDMDLFHQRVALEAPLKKSALQILLGKV